MKLSSLIFTAGALAPLVSARGKGKGMVMSDGSVRLKISIGFQSFAFSYCSVIFVHLFAFSTISSFHLYFLFHLVIDSVNALRLRHVLC